VAITALILVITLRQLYLLALLLLLLLNPARFPSPPVACGIWRLLTFIGICGTLLIVIKRILQRVTVGG